MNNILQLKNLKVSLDKNLILKDVNISCEKNKITSIIGPSGCGKSTLIKSINNIIKEENSSAKIEGQILFKGRNINELTSEELRKSIGCVFQMPAPFPFSIYNNMTYALKYYGVNSKKELERIVEEKLTQVGLFDEVKNNLKMSALKLSGGQQQRLCIARALTIEPEILLLDEPCSALDLNNTMKIENLLQELSKQYTIILVTHNLSEAKRISHYTSFLLNGEIIEYRKTDEFFSNPADMRTREYIQIML